MEYAYTYILECNDGSYYVGSTIDLERRFAQHNAGEGAEYTKHRRPVKLVYFEECLSIKDAFLREKQIQGWSRKKRQALIEKHYEKLPELSKKVVSTSSTTERNETKKVVSTSSTTGEEHK